MPQVESREQGRREERLQSARLVLKDYRRRGRMPNSPNSWNQCELLRAISRVLLGADVPLRKAVPGWLACFITLLCMEARLSCGQTVEQLSCLRSLSGSKAFAGAGPSAPPQSAEDLLLVFSLSWDSGCLSSPG